MTALSITSSVGGRDRDQHRSRRRRFLDGLVGYGLIAPAGVFYLGFQVLPILFAFVLSFFDWNGINLATARFVGFGNYVELFGDDSFWRSVVHNLLAVVLGEFLNMRENTDLGASLFFHSNIGMRGRMVSNEDKCKRGGASQSPYLCCNSPDHRSCNRSSF